MKSSSYQQTYSFNWKRTSGNVQSFNLNYEILFPWEEFYNFLNILTNPIYYLMCENCIIFSLSSLSLHNGIRIHLRDDEILFFHLINQQSKILTPLCIFFAISIILIHPFTSLLPDRVGNEKDSEYFIQLKKMKHESFLVNFFARLRHCCFTLAPRQLKWVFALVPMPSSVTTLKSEMSRWMQRDWKSVFNIFISRYTQNYIEREQKCIVYIFLTEWKSINCINKSIFSSCNFQNHFIAAAAEAALCGKHEGDFGDNRA